MDLKAPDFTRRQELYNSLVHGLGTLLSIAALVLLVVRAVRIGGAIHIFSFSVFGSALLLLFFSSTMQHGLTEGRARRVFEVVDFIAIFVLIAGTNTPFTLVTLRGPLGWSLFGILWGLALLGSSFILRFRRKGRKFAAFLYLAMGWILAFAFVPLSRRLEPAGLALVVGGGLTYSLGIIFFLWKRYLHHHAIWHSFVLAGAVQHFFAIYGYVR
jgi:hemolysin III